MYYDATIVDISTVDVYIIYMTSICSPATPRYRALLQLLRTADIIWDASRAFFDRWDLSPSQFNVLNLLHLNPDGLSQSDLSRFLIVHRSNVTGLVDRLEKRGFLCRKNVVGDRRAYRVVLTQTGQDLIAKILPAYYRGAEAVWNSVPESRVMQHISDLEEVSETARRMAEQISATRH